MTAKQVSAKWRCDIRAGMGNLTTLGQLRSKVADYLGQFEGAPLREGQDAVGEADIAVHQLDSPADVLVRLSVNQRAQALGTVVLGLDLYRDEAICGSGEEIHFKRRVVPLEVCKRHAGLDHGFTDDVLNEATFPCAKVS